MSQGTFQIASALSVQNGSQSYQSQPQQFNGKQANNGGPVPGMLLVQPGGQAVTLTPLVTPGLYRIQNLDATNAVYFGVYDGTTGKSYLPFKILPGESYIGRLSEFVDQELSGTGTHEANTCVLWVRAANAPCKVLIEVFES